MTHNPTLLLLPAGKEPQHDYESYKRIVTRSIKAYAYGRGYHYPTESECLDVFHSVIVKLLESSPVKDWTYELEHLASNEEWTKGEIVPPKAKLCQLCREEFRADRRRKAHRNESLKDILDNDHPTELRLPTERYIQPDYYIEQVEQRQYLQEVLSPQEYRVIEHTLEGYSQKEISGKIKTSLRTVKRLVSTAKKSVDKDLLFAR